MRTKNQNLAIERRVFQYIRKNGLIEAGKKVLVAVSGGPDSVCLLHILYLLQTDLQINLHVAHLDHQLRGTESEADAHYVEDLARKLKIPATIEKRDVAAYQAGRHLSPEEAAREVRYGFLAQTAQTLGTDLVAVGHTKNDQSETILLHIIRGTGTRGLLGLKPWQAMRVSDCNLTLVRPLLGIDRAETEDYCCRLQLLPCLDSSNLSFSALRNRVRHELIPLLQTYNPGVTDSLLRLAQIASDDLAFLDIEMEKAWRKIVSITNITPEPAKDKPNTEVKKSATTGARQRRNELENKEVFVLDKAKFKGLPSALQRHFLRRVIDMLLGTLKDIETRHIEEMLGALDKPSGKMIALPNGLVFGIDYDRYLLGFYPEGPAPFPDLKGVYEIKVPGKTEIPGWEIEATIIRQISNYRLKILSKIRKPGYDNKTRFDIMPGRKCVFSACFDFAKTGDKIKVKAREKGERFQPLGMNRLKKLGEFMLDARIPRSWRGRIPIFYSPDQIIWLAGWRIDERVKVSGETREALCIKVVRVDEQYRTSRENR